MSDHTKIEWTDATWNPVTGCTMVDAGCTNCYAMGLAGTRLKHHPSRAGLTRITGSRHVWTGEVRLNDDWIDQPLRWRKPRRIFVCAHGDLFHEAVPDEWIDRVFAVMALAQQHIFQVLTKRPERAREYFRETTGWRARIAEMLNDAKPSPLWNGNVYQGWQNLHGRPDGLPNVWLGTSISDQASADLRIPALLEAPAAVRFVSAEPLLGRVNLTLVKQRDGYGIDCLTGTLTDFGVPFADAPAKLDWVICGGESGRDARTMHPDWARSLRDQCVAAGVPFFFKQWGEFVPVVTDHHEDDGRPVCFDDGCGYQPVFTDECFQAKVVTQHKREFWRVGKARAGRLLDGQEWSQMPGVL